MNVVIQIVSIILSSVACGGLLYASFSVWPLDMPAATGLIAGLGGGFCWAALMSVFFHSRSDASSE